MIKAETKPKFQRVARKDAELMLEKLIKDFRSPVQCATIYEEDYAGASKLFINEDVVQELIKKLTR